MKNEKLRCRAKRDGLKSSRVAELRPAAAGGRERRRAICAAVGKRKDQRKPAAFSGHRKPGCHSFSFFVLRFSFFSGRRGVGPYERKICVHAVGEGLAPPVSPEARPTLTGGDKPRPYGARKPNVHAVGATLAVARGHGTTSVPAVGATLAVARGFCTAPKTVIARSAATWQSVPGRKQATGIRHERKRGKLTECHCEERSDAAIRSGEATGMRGRRGDPCGRPRILHRPKDCHCEERSDVAIRSFFTRPRKRERGDGGCGLPRHQCCDTGSSQ